MKHWTPILAAAAAAGLFCWSLRARAQAAPPPVPAGEPAAAVDLTTKEGAALLQAQWRYSDARLVEVDGLDPAGRPVKATVLDPPASDAARPDFDDTAWEVLDPTTLGKPRGTGRVSFNWYRIQVTIPTKIGEFDPAGATLVLETLVNDYAEVWVDGALRPEPGQSGGGVIRGYNAADRIVAAKGLKPGQKVTIALFGINGPISAAPKNWISVQKARLAFYPSGG